MILFVGIQASGKSSFYRAYFEGKYHHISLDVLHTRHREWMEIEQCLKLGLDFVVDNTNPARADREKYIVAAKQYGYRVDGYYFQSCIGECMERNEKREGKAKVPRCAIAATSKKLELPEYKEGFDRLYYVSIGSGGWQVEDWKEEKDWDCDDKKENSEKRMVKNWEEKRE